jgi:hypothetical protein
MNLPLSVSPGYQTDLHIPIPINIMTIENINTKQYFVSSAEIEVIDE